MRKATITGIKNGMATVVYCKTGKSSGPMPILSNPMNELPEVGDLVVVAPLDGRRDGIVLGTYWNQNNIPGGMKS